MLEILAKEVTEMEERGFIRDMLDVKVLILFVAATGALFGGVTQKFLFTKI